mgnify:FL=1
MISRKHIANHFSRFIMCSQDVNLVTCKMYWICQQVHVILPPNVYMNMHNNLGNHSQGSKHVAIKNAFSMFFLIRSFGMVGVITYREHL